MNDLQRRTKAHNMRYKKAVLEGMNWNDINDELYEISCECDNFRYYFEDDHETLLNALDGNDEEEYEFRMLFSDLSANCDRLLRALNEYGVNDNFDDFFVGTAGGDNYNIMGFDVYEEDYYRLTGIDINLAQDEAGKRLMRMTKEQIINTAGRCFNVMVCFLDIRYKYDYLKAAFDILKNENTAFLSAIKDIEDAYEKISDAGWPLLSDISRKYDKMLEALPDKVWLE